MSADMAPSGHTVAAAPTDDMTFATHQISGAEGRDVAANLDNCPHELVTDDERRGDSVLRPGIPVINVEIGAANASTQHANEDIIDSDRRYWHFLQPQARLALVLDQCFHCAPLLMRRCVHRDRSCLAFALPGSLSALLPPGELPNACHMRKRTHASALSVKPLLRRINALVVAWIERFDCHPHGRMYCWAKR